MNTTIEKLIEEENKIYISDVLNRMEDTCNICSKLFMTKHMRFYDCCVEPYVVDGYYICDECDTEMLMIQLRKEMLNDPPHHSPDLPLPHHHRQCSASTHQSTGEH